MEKLFPDSIILRIKVEDLKARLGLKLHGENEVVQTITNLFNHLAPGAYKTKMVGDDLTVMPFFTQAASAGYPLVPGLYDSPPAPEKSPLSRIVSALWERTRDFVRPTPA